GRRNFRSGALTWEIGRRCDRYVQKCERRQPPSDSIARLRPSTKPASLKPFRKAASKLAPPAGVPPRRNPTTGTPRCCALAANGHAAATPPIRLAKSGHSFHSITASARARTVGGMVSPIALAVLRLIASSSLVGSSTGRSAGFDPLRILSTYVATC